VADAVDTEVASQVKAAAGGDSAAWNALVGRFAGLVWSVTRSCRLSHADAADVSQTTWLRLAEHIGKIDNPERVGAWLATAARRECLQHIRASSRAIPVQDMTWFEGAAAGSEDPTGGAVLTAESEREAAQRIQALRRAFGRLEPRCRELLHLLMATPPPSYTDVATALDRPVGSIGPTRARCLQRLRRELEATG